MLGVNYPFGGSLGGKAHLHGNFGHFDLTQNAGEWVAKAPLLKQV